MHGAKFGEAAMLQAVFTAAVIDQCDFHGATLGGATKDVAAVFSSAYLANCVFEMEPICMA